MFIKVRVVDIIDIVLVAYLMYQTYLWIKGTPALNIFVGIISFYLLWRLVKALDMQMLSTVLGQVIGVGVIALIIVFQQELRRLLLLVGTKYFQNMQFSIDNLFIQGGKPVHSVRIKSIHKAANRMSKTKTGALMVISRNTNLLQIAETGDRLDAITSSRLIESVFMKNGPLHDGAIIIENERILAARCILPISENFKLPAEFGMRRQAALGASENTDAVVVVVSEETGRISIAEGNELRVNVNSAELLEYLQAKFASPQQ
ncbi:MAG: TIGR00159 family protein [Bacteroidales bacterium]|nr:TIGR00159 family protein [Bacteroidales bacterium]